MAKLTALESSHRSSRERQAAADRRAVPIIRAGRQKGRTYRTIAADLDRAALAFIRRARSYGLPLRAIAWGLDDAGIEPPGRQALNSYGSRPAGWSAEAVRRLCERHCIRKGRQDAFKHRR